MDLLEDTDLLLDLLREAGDEAVTLDELEVVGVRDPARALFELELAGHAVSRVTDASAPGRRLTCVRLGAPAPVAARPPAPVTLSVPHSDAGRIALGALLGALLVLLVTGARRR